VEVLVEHQVVMELVVAEQVATEKEKQFQILIVLLL
jgi:hypothetical protein